MNVHESINACLNDLSVSENTIIIYRKGLYRFTDFLEERQIKTSSDISCLTIDHFIAFLPWLNKHYKKGSVRVYGAASKALMDWMLINRHLTISAGDVALYKAAVRKSGRRNESRLRRRPERTDVPRMLKAVHLYEEESPRRERNIALIEFLASSGCRNNEVLSLTVKDIDLENCRTIVRGKGNKERWVFFGQSTADAIESYWKARGSHLPTDPAFARHDRGAGKKKLKRLTTTSTRNIVKQIGKIAGIKQEFSPHYFRHAFALRVLAESHDLALAQDLLGHEDPKTTREYTKGDRDDLQAAHRKIFDTPGSRAGNIERK